MIILESILLWLVAAIAVIMILQLVLRAPQSAERPEAGLGKRFPVGGLRRARSNYTRAEATGSRLIDAQPLAPVAKEDSRQTIPAQPENSGELTVVQERKNKKRTDTMQMMLNKAMAERR